MIKIRLEGTLDDIQTAAVQIKENFKVLSQSNPYKDRGTDGYYRVYLDCELKNHDKKWNVKTAYQTEYDSFPEELKQDLGKLCENKILISEIQKKYNLKPATIVHYLTIWRECN